MMTQIICFFKTYQGVSGLGLVGTEVLVTEHLLGQTVQLGTSPTGQETNLMMMIQRTVFTSTLTILISCRDTRLVKVNGTTLPVSLRTIIKWATFVRNLSRKQT